MNYILQKDIPGLHKGMVFKPTSALAYGYIETNAIHIEYAKDFVENNPEWFLPETTRIYSNLFTIRKGDTFKGEMVTEIRLEDDKVTILTKPKKEATDTLPKKEEPKEWEILSFKQNTGITDLWTKFDKGWCRNSNGVAVTVPYTYNGILSNPLYNIHSVKRLSDGEVFTVGDMVGWGVTKDYQTKLLEFRINDKGVLEFKYMNFTNRYSFIDFIKAHELYKVKKEEPIPSNHSISEMGNSHYNNQGTEPIPIKVEVNTVWLNEELTNNYTKGWYAYQFSINTSIHPAQFPLIKKAIESVLRGNEDMGNIETFNRGYKMGWNDASKYDQKQHTSEELLQARSEAFKAARQLTQTDFHHTPYNYRTFNDYLNSIK